MHLDHLLLRVPPSTVDGLVAFLIASLKHMGFREHARPVPSVVGLGAEWSWLWINGSEGSEEEEVQTVTKALKGMHVAFSATDKAQVDQFHEAALKAGGKDNGKPGPRPHYQPTFYGPTYYGAFVLDPECGVNFEVVYKGE